MKNEKKHTQNYVSLNSSANCMNGYGFFACLLLLFCSKFLFFEHLVQITDRAHCNENSDTEQ